MDKTEGLQSLAVRLPYVNCLLAPFIFGFECFKALATLHQQCFVATYRETYKRLLCFLP
jgi:hypothetical protein